MLPSIDAILLAGLCGVTFGVFVTRFGSSWERLAWMLFALWILQTVAQTALRMMNGNGRLEELVQVSILDLVFAIPALAFVWWFERRLDAEQEKR